MEPEFLLPRLALARGWISQEAYNRVLERISGLEAAGDLVEEALRAEGISGDQVRTLQGALRIRRKEVSVGDWRLLRRLGIGGMGSVFEARHRRTARRAALKILLPRLGRDPGFTARFIREARALARVSHPNIVQALDAGKEGEFHYIAMELVEGENLLQRIDREGRMDPEPSARIMREVARGIEGLEAAGLAHRDVKPSNILIDSAGLVKLTDLGLFRDATDSRGIQDGMVFGTPQYMSPEQIRGQEGLDVRSDLYSLGATWYHALIGQPPFRGGAPIEVARKHLEEMPIALRAIRPDIPADLDRLVMRLLAKDPGMRPAGPGEVIAQIDRFLGASTPLRSPAPGAPAPWDNGGRAPRRPPRRVLRMSLVLPALAALVACGAGLGILAGKGCRPGARPPAEGGPKGVLFLRDEVLPALPGALGAAQRSIRRGLDVVAKALPRFPLDLAAVSRAAPSVPPPALPEMPRTVQDSPGPVPTAAVPAVPRRVFSQELRRWAQQGAAEANSRFLGFLGTLAEGRAIDVVTRSGAILSVKPSPGSQPGLCTPEGRTVPIREVHPAAVIVWAQADPETPLGDGGLGLAVQEDFPGLARLVLGILAPDVPESVRTAVDAMPPDTAPGALAGDPGEAFAAACLKDIQEERKAWLALSSGRWAQAAEGFGALLSRQPPSAMAPIRKEVWKILGDRSALFGRLTVDFLAGPIFPVDPLRDGTLRLRYFLDDPKELRDFRFDPRAWSWSGGALRRGTLPPAARDAGRPAVFAAPLDGVALFRTPAVVEVAWAAPQGSGGRILVGLGDRFIALGPAGILAVWRGPLEDGRLPETPVRSGSIGSRKVLQRYALEFREDRIVTEVSDLGRMEFPLEPAPGLQGPEAVPAREALDPAAAVPCRLTIALDPGAALEEVSITGILDPIWMHARIGALGTRMGR